MMFCNYCGNFLSKKWKYCPYCGKKIGGEPDIFDALFRGGINGISIRITSRDGKKPKVEVNQLRSQRKRRVPIEEKDTEEGDTQLLKKKRHPVPKKVLEPEGQRQQVGEHTVIRVKLPGVKEEDIDVRKLEESVEVKAYKDGEAYFKQFAVPESAKIISQHMEGNELIVEVG